MLACTFYQQHFFQFYNNFLQNLEPPSPIITTLNCLSGLTCTFAFVLYSKFFVFFRISFITLTFSLASNFTSKFVAYWKKCNSHRIYSPWDLFSIKMACTCDVISRRIFAGKMACICDVISRRIFAGKMAGICDVISRRMFAGKMAWFVTSFQDECFLGRWLAFVASFQDECLLGRRLAFAITIYHFSVNRN